MARGIYMEPNNPREGDGEGAVAAFMRAAYFNCVFDDVTGEPGLYFCMKWSDDEPIVDYHVTDAELEAWAAGKAPLDLDPLPHDPGRFGELNWD